MLIKNLYTVTHFKPKDFKVNALVSINKDNPIFAGHFPKNPVMPGVCMIQIIKELTEKVTHKKLFLQKANNIKFMAIINPEKNPDLRLEISFLEEDAVIKVKNTTYFNETLALKFSGEFKIV